MKEWFKAKARFIWCHRTKAIGVLAGIGATIENTLAQYGHVIPQRYHGLLLGIAGMITFCIGLYNSFA